jgi:hypothetical protein
MVMSSRRHETILRTLVSPMKPGSQHETQYLGGYLLCYIKPSVVNLPFQGQLNYIFATLVAVDTDAYLGVVQRKGTTSC